MQTVPKPQRGSPGRRQGTRPPRGMPCLPPAPPPPRTRRGCIPPAQPGTPPAAEAESAVAAAVVKDAGAAAQTEAAGARAGRFLGIWRASTRRRRQCRRQGMWGRRRRERRWQPRPQLRPPRCASASQGRRGGWPRSDAAAPRWSPWVTTTATRSCARGDCQLNAFEFGVREGKEMRSGRAVGTTGRERRKEEAAEPI
jgi:hypothetical protein